MVETEKQLIVYVFEIIASILIGVLVGMAQNSWYGAFAGGITLFVLLVCNSLLFRKNLLIESVIFFGFVSLIATSLGAYFTFGIYYSIGSIIIILIAICALIFYAKNYFLIESQK
jgi:hypothetical protein